MPWPRHVKPPHIDDQFLSHVPLIHKMQNSLILDFYSPFLAGCQLLSIVIQHLLVLRHSESILDELADLVKIGIGWSVYQECLFLIVADVEIY